MSELNEKPEPIEQLHGVFTIMSKLVDLLSEIVHNYSTMEGMSRNNSAILNDVYISLSPHPVFVFRIFDGPIKDSLPEYCKLSDIVYEVNHDEYGIALGENKNILWFTGICKIEESFDSFYQPSDSVMIEELGRTLESDIKLLVML